MAEKSLKWGDRRVNLAGNEHLSPEYLAINPNGVVPTLVHDSMVVADSHVICEYLDEVFPSSPLTPRDPGARARMRAWMRYIEEVLTVAVRYPSFNMAFVQRYEGLTEQEFRARYSDIRPLRMQFYRRMGPTGFSDNEIEAALENCAKSVMRMDEALKGKPWLVGDEYTLADISVVPLIDRLADLGFSYLWDDHPAIADWYARIQGRTAFKKAFYPGTRLSELHRLVPAMDRKIATAIPA